jgi:hypothetical protein
MISADIYEPNSGMAAFPLHPPDRMDSHEPYREVWLEIELTIDGEYGRKTTSNHAFLFDSRQIRVFDQEQGEDKYQRRCDSGLTDRILYSQALEQPDSILESDASFERCGAI